MLRSYLTVALRTLWRNRTQSFINILGLSLGMACALLMAVLTADELSYERFHTKGDRIYKVYNRNTFEGKVHCWYVTPAPLGPTLKAEFPEVAAVSRMTWGETYLTAYGTKKVSFKTPFVDPDFLTIFSFPLLRGNIKTALSNPKSAVLTLSSARKLFGAVDPMGKLIRLDNQHDFIVGGILQDPPTNTELAFDMLLPWSFMKTAYGYDDIYWGNNSYRTYVELTPGASLAAVNQKIRDVTIRHSKGDEDNEVFLYPSARWRLYGQFENGVESGGAIVYLRMAQYIALFILLLACINFMNLSTARSEKRGREVGIRKVVGANRSSLVGQFMGESLLLTFGAFILALLIAQLALPGLNQLAEGKTMTIPYTSGWFWLGCLALVLLTGILAGSYPALFLSAMQPIRVLKGRLNVTRGNLTPRQLLVVFQFIITVSLLICTVIVKRQLAFTQERDMGYNRDRLVYMPMVGDITKNYDIIRSELLRQQVATAVCKASNAITSSSSNTWGISWRGKPEGSKITFDQIGCPADYIKTMGLTLVAGRDLDTRTYPGDSLACLVNETAVKTMGFKNPIGEEIRNGNYAYRIVGVFKDFIWGSPFQAIPPMFVKGNYGNNYLHYRLNPALPTQVATQKARAIFQRYNPAFPFNLTFIDQEFDHKFDRVRSMGRLANIFAVLAILIACLGLFGLAAFMAERRTKEIGVRKTMGASIPSLVSLLNRDFLKLVVIAIFIAIPLAWWLMDWWLQDYNYRTPLDWWLFAAAAAIAILVALLTVSYQSIRAALTNPIEALKSE